jgi:hypothetical protein
MPSSHSSVSGAAQTDASEISGVDLLKALFAFTEHPIYVCSFPNERHDETQASERHLMTRLPGQITSFVDKWDKPGRGAFFCLATISGDKRNKANTRESTCLFTDLDLDKIDMLPSDEVAARKTVLEHIKRLRYQPSALVSSGGGVHAYWLLKEPLATQDHMERIEAALRQLADIVAGDLAVCEVARVLRMPGSHNTKRGEHKPVEIIELHPERRYNIEELEDWLSEQSPIMLRKKRAQAMPAGAATGEIDFFAEYAKQHGIKMPIDVESRLENMMYMGGGESSIHQTQLVVTAALLNRGMPKEDVVAVVLAATKRAAGEYTARWNWRREERKLHGMCDSWLIKHPPEERKGKPKLTSIEGGVVEMRSDAPPKKKQEQEKQIELSTNVVQMPKHAISNMPKKNEQHITLGQAVLARVLANGEELINTKDGAWFYSEGVWELCIDHKWIDVRIEEACRGLGFTSGSKLINETRNWIARNPELWRKKAIPWDQHGKIPTRSGLIDPRTGEIEPARPDHFCTWRVDVDYDPAATCPWWRTMIADMFGDKSESERSALVLVVQECIGAALIDKKPRALSKACVFWGNENRAKSGVLDVVTGLFGGNPVSAGIGTVDSTHGLMPFLRRAPWVLHEAFNGQWNFSSIVKAIITQEPVQINIKNGPMITHVVRAPIFWATNFQPQFKEATKAIVSRMIVIEVTRAFIEGNPMTSSASEPEPWVTDQ